MKFSKDEELFQNIPARENQKTYDSMHTIDSTKENAEPVCEVYNKCYKKVAGEKFAAHKGSINDIYTAEEINKDFQQIAHKIDQALETHLETTNGYIGEFPKSRKYYATVDKTDDYYFDYFRWCGYDTFSLMFPLSKLNALVDQARFKMSAIKSALALSLAIVCMALMWFCQSWFFTYEGLGLVKISGLALVFIGMLALIWWSGHDPEEFASQLSLDESPVGYLSIGVIASVLVRIFLSGASAAIVCCVAAGICGLCFLARMLSANKRLRQIKSRSPVLRKLSLGECEHFERNAQRIYRFVRFLELWFESENGGVNRQHLEYIRKSMMEYVDEYDQWCRKYLGDSDDTAI